MAMHGARITWQGTDADAFLGRRYSRAHTWTFDGGLTVPASASPHIVPLRYTDPAAIDPEEAFVAALASCHMLWFLSLAAERGFVVERYEDAAEGTLGPGAGDANGRLVMTRVVLRPVVAFGGDVRPSDEDVAALHEAAHGRCFLAASVRCPVEVEGL